MSWFFDEFSKYKGFSPACVTGRSSAYHLPSYKLSTYYQWLFAVQLHRSWFFTVTWQASVCTSKRNIWKCWSRFFWHKQVYITLINKVEYVWSYLGISLPSLPICGECIHTSQGASFSHDRFCIYKPHKSLLCTNNPRSSSLPCPVNFFLQTSNVALSLRKLQMKLPCWNKTVKEPLLLVFVSIPSCNLTVPVYQQYNKFNIGTLSKRHKWQNFEAIPVHQERHGYWKFFFAAGKPVELFGSRGREYATGRGVVLASREALRLLGLGSLKNKTCVVQVRLHHLIFITNTLVIKTKQLALWLACYKLLTCSFDEGDYITRPIRNAVAMRQNPKQNLSKASDCS